jgi:DNA-directed RNA polymerase subunit omega
MDPLAVFDCQRFVPNRFALVLAAAARGRALRRGVAPRITAATDCAAVIALQEIAAGAVTAEEIDQFLSSQRRADAARLSGSPEFGDDAVASVVTLAPDAGSHVECNCAAQKEKEDLHVEQHHQKKATRKGHRHRQRGHRRLSGARAMAIRLRA